MRTVVQRDHARFVDHFLKQQHIPRSLKDLSSIPVYDRQNRAGNASCDATDVEAEIFPRRRIIARSARNGSGLGFGRQVRRPAVWRIDNQRCLPARPSRTLAPVSWGIHVGLSIWSNELLLVVFSLPSNCGLALSEFFVRQIELVAEIALPLQWSVDAVVACPSSLQIRIAPRRLGLS